MILEITLVPAAKLRLEKIAEETGRKVNDIAAEWIENQARAWFEFAEREDDPALLSVRDIFEKFGPTAKLSKEENT